MVVWCVMVRSDERLTGWRSVAASALLRLPSKNERSRVRSGQLQRRVGRKLARYLAQYIAIALYPHLRVVALTRLRGLLDRNGLPRVDLHGALRMTIQHSQE